MTKQEQIDSLKSENESLNNRVENYEELVSQLEDAIVFPEVDDQDRKLDKVKEILGLTPKKVYEKRMASGDTKNG